MPNYDAGFAPRAAPTLHGRRVNQSGFPTGRDNAIRQRPDQCAVIAVQAPVAPAFHNLVAPLSEKPHNQGRRLRACRRSKSLVARLMRMKCVSHGCVMRMWGYPSLLAVIGQRRIERQALSREQVTKCPQPSDRDEIKQGRRRDEVGGRRERFNEIASQVGLNEFDVDLQIMLRQAQAILNHPDPVRPAAKGAAGRLKQRWIVIDQPPELFAWQMRRQRAQIGAGAATEIDDRDPAAVGEMRGASCSNFAIARGAVSGLTQREPYRIKPVHLVCPIAWRRARRTVCAASRQRGCAPAAAQERADS